MGLYWGGAGGGNLVYKRRLSNPAQEGENTHESNNLPVRASPSHPPLSCRTASSPRTPWHPQTQWHPQTPEIPIARPLTPPTQILRFRAHAHAIPPPRRIRSPPTATPQVPRRARRRRRSAPAATPAIRCDPVSYISVFFSTSSRILFYTSCCCRFQFEEKSRNRISFLPKKIKNPMLS
jgi:hypothetical protein